MINFILKRVNDNSPHFNVTIMKIVHKRSGELVEEPGETLYSIPLDVVKSRLAHLETERVFEDRDISLKEYLTEFYKSYNKICELLKKIL